VTENRLGLFNVPQSEIDWTDKVIDILKEQRPPEKPVDDAQVEMIFRSENTRNMSSDDGPILASVKKDARIKNWAKPFQIILISEDIRLAKQIADVTEATVNLFRPKEIILAGLKDILADGYPSNLRQSELLERSLKDLPKQLSTYMDTGSRDAALIKLHNRSSPMNVIDEYISSSAQWNPDGRRSYKVVMKPLAESEGRIDSRTYQPNQNNNRL